MELDGNELDWTGRAQIPLNGLDLTSEEWAGLDRAGQYFRRLNWTTLHLTGLDCLSLSSTSADCTTLHYPGSNYKVPYTTVTAPRYIDLHRTAFHVS